MADEESELVRALRDAKPEWLKRDGPNIRPSDLPARVPGELRFPQSKVVRPAIEPLFPEAADAAEETTVRKPVVAATTFDFMIVNASEEDAPAISVLPGYVLNTMATMDETATPLTADPAPTLDVSSSGTVYLMVHTKARDTLTNDFRTSIDTVKVKKLNLDEKEPLKVVWTDMPNSIGDFYIKIGDVFVGDDGAIASIRQYLRTSIRTFVIAVDQVMILA